LTDCEFDYIKSIESSLSVKRHILEDLTSGKYKTSKADIEYYVGAIHALESTRRDFMVLVESQKMGELN
jgi:hypothetical protein